MAAEWRASGGQMACQWRAIGVAPRMALCKADGMNETRIAELRQERGWTQDKLASESGVGIRTIQRMEAGNDASLETLSLVATALRVSVRELFSSIDNDEFSERVDSLQSLSQSQQTRRNRVSTAWLWLYIGIGVVVSMISFGVGGQLGGVLFVAFWGGGTLIFLALRRLLVDPRLDAALPLSHSKAELRRRQRERDAKTPEEKIATS